MPFVDVEGTHGVPFSSGIVSGPNIVSKSPSISFVMIISSRIILPLSGSYDGGDSSLLSFLGFLDANFSFYFGDDIVHILWRVTYQVLVQSCARK